MFEYSPENSSELLFEVDVTFCKVDEMHYTSDENISYPNLFVKENIEMFYQKIVAGNYVGALDSEISFELPNIEFNLDLASIWIPLVATIAIIAVVAWYITRPPKTSTTGSAVKAQLIGLGEGSLEFIDNILSFHWEKGYFRRRRIIVRKIPIDEIESMNRTDNELSIAWKGVTDLFIIEEPELAGSIFEIIPQTSREQRKIYEEKQVAKQTRNELITILSDVMETIDSLFDILRSLHGWVDWVHTENLLKRSEENAKHLDNQQIGLTPLNFLKLTSAIKAHLLKETSKETYSLLKYLHDYFSKLTMANEPLRQLNPNLLDIRTIILADYMLNDIILGIIVGDTVEKEINSLTVSLEKLSKNTDLKTNIDRLKNSINKLCVEHEKERVIQKTRMVLRRQLEDIKTIESRRFIKQVYPPPKASTLSRAKKIFRSVITLAYRWLHVFSVKIRKTIKKEKMKR
jgi:hypothetical protein